MEMLIRNSIKTIPVIMCWEGEVMKVVDEMNCIELAEKGDQWKAIVR